MVGLLWSLAEEGLPQFPPAALSSSHIAPLCQGMHPQKKPWARHGSYHVLV
jgi:hypothetical protein